jgi:hypothetical protein
MSPGNRRRSLDAEEPYRRRNSKRGRETRASRKNLEDAESQESCIHRNWVKPVDARIPGWTGSKLQDRPKPRTGASFYQESQGSQIIKSLVRETPVVMCPGAQVVEERKPWKAGNDEGAG